MKLIEGMVTDHLGDDFVAVATGKAAQKFVGLIRGNKTADFLLNQLMTEKTEQQLVDALLSKYDVDADTARTAVTDFVGKLREAGLLDG